MSGPSPAYSQEKASKIFAGRIVDVNVSTYTVSVACEYVSKPQTGISFSTPYQHFVNGEGSYFMPEVGSLCWLCFPSDNSRPFVIAWRPMEEEKNFRSRKKSLNPGDIYMGTRDENFLILRRGGVVQIGGGPLSQRIFIPVNNIIKDYCDNYGLHTLGGDLEWTIARPENTKDGTRPANLKIKAKEFADDPNPIAQLEIGSHEQDSQTILSLRINENGDSGAANKFNLKISKSGDVVWTMERDLTWTLEGKFTVSSADDMTLTSDGAASFSGDSVTIEATGLGQDVDIESKTNVNIAAGLLVDVGPKLRVGESSIPVLLATSTLLLWIAAHTHPVIALGAPTGIPIPPDGLPTPGAVSTKIFG